MADSGFALWLAVDAFGALRGAIDGVEGTAAEEMTGAYGLHTLDSFARRAQASLVSIATVIQLGAETTAPA